MAATTATATRRATREVERTSERYGWLRDRATAGDAFGGREARSLPPKRLSSANGLCEVDQAGSVGLRVGDRGPAEVAIAGRARVRVERRQVCLRVVVRRQTGRQVVRVHRRCPELGNQRERSPSGVDALDQRKRGGGVRRRH